MIATETYEGPDRRRSDLAGLIARATFPLRETLKEFDWTLCRFIGHKWIEVPSSHLSARARTGGRMRFKCSRCFLMGGFTN